MPDLDVISQTLPPKWRRTGNLIRGASSAVTVADSIVVALAETLRKGGGCPALDDLTGAAHEVVSGLDAEALDRATERAIHEARGTPSYPAVLMAGEVAQALVATDQLSGLTREVAAHRIAIGFLQRLVKSNLVDRLVPALMRDSTQALGDVVKYVDDCVSDADIDGLANRLLAHQDGKRLRAPRRRRPTQRTADILHAPLSPFGHAP